MLLGGAGDDVLLGGTYGDTLASQGGADRLDGQGAEYGKNSCDDDPLDTFVARCALDNDGPAAQLSTSWYDVQRLATRSPSTSRSQTRPG